MSGPSPYDDSDLFGDVIDAEPADPYQEEEMALKMPDLPLAPALRQPRTLEELGDEAQRLPNSCDLVKAAIAPLLTAPTATMNTWASELNLISRAAAVQGQFREAIEGYKLLGDHFGTTKKVAEQQHFHIHDAPHVIRETPTQELEQRLAELREKKQRQREQQQQTQTPPQ